jgi:hypothetical protein
MDTSAVMYVLHGHSLQQAAVREAVADGPVAVPVFVRMEYLRGILCNLIELYGLLKEALTVTDALAEWPQKIHQERKLKTVLLTIGHWLPSDGPRSGKEETLRRLGDWIFRAVAEFDETFGPPPPDPLACTLGRLTLPQADFEEDLLFDFYARFRSIQRGTPDCRLCPFRQAQQRRLRLEGIDLTGVETRNRHASNTGFLALPGRLDEATATRIRTPSCRWCERVGDALIAGQLPRRAVLVTADRAFLALGTELRREVRLLPSLPELKRRASGD